MVNFSNYCYLKGEEKNIISSWQGFQFDKSFCDVTLSCDEGNIQAHKFVISSSSQIFNNILKNNSKQHQLIYISGAKHKYIENLIQYIYQGVVEIAEDDLDKFLHLAEDLQVEGLSGENKNVEVKIVQCNKEALLNTQYNKEESINITSDTIDMQPNISISESYFVFKDHKDKKSGKNKSLSKSDIKNKKQVTKIQKLLKQDERNSISLKDDIESKITNDKLQKHISVKDNVETPCELCGKLFNKIKMRRHKSSAHKSVKYPCDECDTSPYSDAGGLSRHKKSVHKGVRYQCDECGLSYRDSTGLRKHRESVHKGVRYPCNQCRVLPFRQLSHLSRHRASAHEGITYQCSKCDHRATSKDLLNTHTKKVHNISSLHHE